MIKRLLAVLITMALLLTGIAASAESEPALGFGTGKLVRGRIIFFGKDSAHSSLRWRILDVNDERALLTTKNTVTIYTNYSETQFAFVDMDNLIEYDEEYNRIPQADWSRSFIKKLCAQLYSLWSQDSKHSQEAQALVPYMAEEAERYRAGRFDFEYEPSPMNGEQIFVFSAKEAEQYFDGEADRTCTDADGKPTWWWLRSQVVHNSIYIDKSEIMGVVDDAGWLNSLDILQNYNFPFAGFRPACQLRLANVMFVTAVKDGKPKLGRENEMLPIGSGEYEEWKLTLLAGGRQFKADTAPQTVSPGETVTVIYEKALKGGREAISVILCSKDGTPLYYGSQKSEHVEGTVEFSLPEDIAAGEYVMKVFNEQRNDNRESDVASSFADIPLTIQ